MSDRWVYTDIRRHTSGNDTKQTDGGFWDGKTTLGMTLVQHKELIVLRASKCYGFTILQNVEFAQNLEMFISELEIIFCSFMLLPILCALLVCFCAKAYNWNHNRTTSRNSGTNGAWNLLFGAFLMYSFWWICILYGENQNFMIKKQFPLIWFLWVTP